jgi:mannose-6-phosphate isomerase-like protein (cupin superfamily)
MDAFEISEIMEQHRQAGKSYLEFLRVPALSLGLYVLPAGGTDPQQPHAEDEIYYVLGGRGSIVAGEERRSVQPGSTIFVAAGVEHRFYDITEELQLLVFFAPAESS